jgi:TP53 regulating kinase and related kinases
MDLIASGAEAKIYLDSTNNTILKKRVKKSYRLEVIDESLITSRTKREAKILQKLSQIAPRLISSTKDEILMEYVKGDLVRDILNKKPQIIKQIAESVSFMHDKQIVHGDLTTSNMIFSNNKIILIDFGLSKVSQKEEDKAVDLHLLKESLVSKHFEVFETVWKEFINNYSSKNKKEILLRLEKVESRGKNKK